MGICGYPYAGDRRPERALRPKDLFSRQYDRSQPASTLARNDELKVATVAPSAAATRCRGAELQLRREDARDSALPLALPHPRELFVPASAPTAS